MIVYVSTQGAKVVREGRQSYAADFAPEKATLSPEHSYFWDNFTI